MLKGVYLSLFMGPMVPVPAPKAVVDALISAQVNTGGERSGFQLVFSMNKKSSIRQTLLPSGFMDTGTTRVILVATLGGAPNVLIDGIVTRHEVSPSNEAGQSTITLTGEDLTVLMDVLAFPMLRYPCIPILAQVNLIVIKYAMFGILPVVIPPLFDSPLLPTDTIPSQTGTDLAYIKELAHKVGYIYHLVPGPTPGASVFYFGPDISLPIPQPALMVNMDANTNVESLTFSLDGLCKKLVVMNIMDPVTQSIPIPVPVPPVNILRPPLGVRLTLPMKMEYLEGGNLNPIQGISKALSISAETTEAISASGTLNVLRYGQVLKAFELVGVCGAGPAYDGLYYVRTVTHNIKRGEYKQSFTLSRDGLMSQTPAVPV